MFTYFLAAGAGVALAAVAAGAAVVAAAAVVAPPPLARHGVQCVPPFFPPWELRDARPSVQLVPPGELHGSRSWVHAGARRTALHPA